MTYTTDKRTVEIETDGDHIAIWSNTPLPLLK
ncbi:metallo-beta-lactamase domain protein [Bacillus pseudomycoides]|nr:metallo-beta-lactamase domain protein [Bacillus pseudomycoides]